MNAPRLNKEQEIYIGLGSNIRPEKNLPLALEMLSQVVRLKSHSSAWETPPVGMDTGPNFINAVALISTDYPIDELRQQVLRQIESQLGRVRTTNQNAPRPIDLDIIIINDQIIDPRIWDRAYLAIPLAEIGFDVVNPRENETLSQAARRLARQTPIQQRPEILRKMGQNNIGLET